MRRGAVVPCDGQVQALAERLNNAESVTLFCGAGVVGAVDHDPARLGRRTPLELAIHGDVAATLRVVLPLVMQKIDRSLLDRMLRRHARALEHVIDAYTTTPSTMSRSTPSTRRGSSMNSPPMTPCSPSTPACATSGQPATSLPTAAGA